MFDSTPPALLKVFTPPPSSQATSGTSRSTDNPFPPQTLLLLQQTTQPAPRFLRFYTGHLTWAPWAFSKTRADPAPSSCRNGHFPLPKLHSSNHGWHNVFKRAQKYLCVFYFLIFFGPKPISTLIQKGTLHLEVHSSPLDFTYVSVLPERSDFPLPMVIKTEAKQPLLPPRNIFFPWSVSSALCQISWGVYFNTKQNWIIHHTTPSLFLAFAVCSYCLDSLWESQIKLAIHHWLPCSYASVHKNIYRWESSIHPDTRNHLTHKYFMQSNIKYIFQTNTIARSGNLWLTQFNLFNERKILWWIMSYI